MAGWATMDPTTREALVTELVQRYPHYQVRDFDPYSVLDPIIMDTRTGQYVDLAGNVLRADGASQGAQGGAGIDAVAIFKAQPVWVWVALAGVAVYMLRR